MHGSRWVLSSGSPPELATPQGLGDATEYRDGRLSFLRPIGVGETVFLRFAASPPSPLMGVVRQNFGNAAAIEISDDLHTK